MIKLFVPGRLCLFGEHTDWVGDRVCTCLGRIVGNRCRATVQVKLNVVDACQWAQGLSYSDSSRRL